MLLTDRDAIEAVADEWRPLAERTGNAFVTPEWFLAWLDAYGPEWEPRVAVVRRPDGSLQGLLPLIGSNGRGATLRACRGDRFHPVSDAGDDRRVAAAAASALGSAEQRPRSIVLDNVESDAEWVDALVDAYPASLATVERPEIEVPFVGLEGLTWEEYLAGRSRGMRSQLSRKMRGLRKQHDVRIRRTTTPGELQADLETLFALHKARWEQRGDHSSFDKPAVHAFHNRFSRAALERGWLRFFVMEVDASPVAALYGWLLGDRWSYLQAGFDPAWSRYSPGFLLLAETIREAIAEGAAEYDLLLGGESYKYRFATGSRRARSVVLVGRTDPMRVSAAARARLRAAWRRVPPAARVRAKRVASRVGLGP